MGENNPTNLIELCPNKQSKRKVGGKKEKGRRQFDLKGDTEIVLGWFYLVFSVQFNSAATSYIHT